MSSKVKLAANVLVMDDEPLVRLMICSALEQAGASVYEAGTCAEAIERFRSTELDAAVFDYRLPDGNGLDVIQLMRKEGHDIPVVLLSGESLEIEEEAARLSGIAAVLPKPPDVDLLAKVVADSIGNGESTETTQVGKYAYWKVASTNEREPEHCLEVDWLAVDLSNLSDPEPGETLVSNLNKPRCGTAVIGANEMQYAFLNPLLIHVDFVTDTEALAALSRRPSTPMERDFLLQSIIQPAGAERDA